MRCAAKRMVCRTAIFSISTVQTFGLSLQFAIIADTGGPLHSEKLCSHSEKIFSATFSSGFFRYSIGEQPKTERNARENLLLFS